VLVNAITPPQFDLNEADGFYDREHGVMHFEAIEAAQRESVWANVPPATEVMLRETHPEVRPWNLDVADIRQGGALFNVMKGASFGDLGTPMLLVLWPGYGVRSARPSFGCGFASPPQLDLYVRTPFYHAGSFEAPPWSTLPNAPAEPASAGAKGS